VHRFWRVSTGRALCAGVSLWFGICFSAGAEMRIWHKIDGTRFDAEFTREALGKIFFQGADKENFSLLESDLVANDIKYLRSVIPPTVDIGFSKKIREMPKSDYAHQDFYSMEITATFKIKKTSRAEFTGQLPAEVYLIGKEVSSDEYRLFEKKGFLVEFPDGKREFNYQLKSVLIHYSEYTGDERGALYEGYVAVVFDRTGTPLAFETNLSWMKKDNLAALRKLPVPGFLDKECRKRPVPRTRSGYTGSDWDY
jgi:hypothetical protein